MSAKDCLRFGRRCTLKEQAKCILCEDRRAPTDPTGEQPQGDNTPPLDDGVTFKDGGGGYIR